MARASREELLQALNHPNIIAFLRVLREGESGQHNDAYRMMFGGELFDVANGWRHPNRAITKGRLTSTAAGAYQFLSKTWQALQAQYDIPDFSSAWQDFGAVALIAGRKALDAVLSGRLDQAIRLCNREWASLPGSPYGQPVLTLARAREIFYQYGGTVADPSELPQEVKPPMAPLIPIILQSLVPMIPQLASMFGSGSEVSNRNIAAGKVIADKLVEVTQAVNIQEAAEKIQSDPSLREQAIVAVADLWPSISEGGGGGIDGARKFATEHGNDRYGRILEVVSYCGMSFLLFANCMAFAIGWFKNDWSRMEAVIQADIGVALMVFGFFLGSSLGSRAKDRA